MSPKATITRWRRLESIFHEVSAATAEARPAMLRSRCEGDAGLLADVQALLEASEEETFLTGQLTASRPPEEREPHIGNRMGAYELESLLGRGGMGAVYLAHRADGEFEHKVAIKVIGLPFELELLRERFRQERQILAGLNHPNITRLLDGGVTGEGQLYLVMEYVDGVPIDKFAASVETKLDLFGDVCGAVRYAHQNLIVHRDIKPSNILVDAGGTVKLLDFGSAKLMAGADATQTGFGMMTLSYASPEQLRGEPATTLSDVYSLGAVLYQLISGEKPFGDDLVARLREEQSGVVNLPKPLPGDLDLVVRKALAPVATERYSSVEQLAEDVRRYRAGETVMAHAPSFRYRAGKFARRNKLALGAATLLLITVLAGIGGVLWQYRTAVEERRKAEARAEDLRKLSASLLTEIDEAIQKLPGSTEVQRLLVSTVLEHLDRTAKDSAGDPQLQLDAANAYIRLGNVQGNPYDQNIGDARGALASLDKAVSLGAAATKEQPGDPAAKHAMAWARQSRSEVLFGMARPVEAVAEMRLAAAAFGDLANRPGATVDAVLDACSANGNLGDELGQTGEPGLSDLPGAVAAYKKSQECAERAIQMEPGNPRVLRAIAVAHRKLGAIQMQTDPGAAVLELRKAIEAFNAWRQRAGSSFNIERTEAGILTPYGHSLAEIGQYSQALVALERSRAIDQGILTADPKDARAARDMSAVLSREAECYQERADGIFPEAGANRQADEANALKVSEERRDLLEGTLRVEPNNPRWHYDLGAVLIDISRLQGSAESAKKGLALLKSVAERKDVQAAELDGAATGLVNVEPATLREPKLAVKYAERAVEMSAHRDPEFLLTLAEAYRAAGQPDKAGAAAQEGLALLPPETPATIPSRLRKHLQAQMRQSIKP